MNRMSGYKVCKYCLSVSAAIRALLPCWAGQGLALCFTTRKMPNKLVSPLIPVPGISSF